jgi:ribosomal protein S18 acetylase RimI-like enzyme
MIDVAEYKRHPPKPGMTYLREPSAFDMQDPIIVRLMQPADLDTLQSICRRAYSENFGHHWQEEGLSEYLEKVFGTNILTAELADPHIRFYVAFREHGSDSAEAPAATQGPATQESLAVGLRAGEPVAFMKLNLYSNLPGAPPEKGIELDKLYILPDCKGQKIGARMMDLAFGVAEMTGKDDFWLAVIDTNAPAITFYEKYGFRFHSTTRVGYPQFREELKGMWRMHAHIKKVAARL